MMTPPSESPRVALRQANHPFAARFSCLVEYQQRIPLPFLHQWLEATPFEPEEMAPFMKFHPLTYLRNLLYAGPAFHALILCWRNGQRSPIHDHHGSSCAVKVLNGQATETFFERAPNGMIYAVGSRILPAGAVCASQDADIHQISNLQAGEADLTTLHVYSPPLMLMNMYSLLDNRVAQVYEPIHDEFALGAGI